MSDGKVSTIEEPGCYTSDWDLSTVEEDVTNMGTLFSGDSAFNSDSSAWDVSNVVADMDNLLSSLGSLDDVPSYGANLNGWIVES